MKRATDKLGELVLAAFEQSRRERRPDVSEHLLRALEVLARDPDREGDAAEVRLHQAYRTIARTSPDRPN